MSVDVLQLKKEEVAQSMLKDFENELNFFQSTVLSFFEKKITQTITSNGSLGNSLEDAKPHMNFLEKMLVSLSPSTAEKVFLFIKDKQEKIIKAKTVEELDTLKSGIVVPTEVKPQNQPTQTPQQVVPTKDQTPSSLPETTNKEEDKNLPLTDDEKKRNNIIE